MFKTTTIIVIALETGINPQSPALFSVSWQVINVWRNKNKYAASCHQIHKKLICPEYFTDNIERKYFCSALKRRLSNKMIYSKEIIVLG